MVSMLETLFSSQCCWCSSLAWIALIFGSISVLSFTFSFLKAIWVYFIRPRVDIKKKFGPWACVTGAADGIGLAYSTELLKWGMNVVMIDRARERLEESAAKLRVDLKLPSNVLIHTIVADFDARSQEARQALVKFLKEQLGNLEIRLLVNNVGVSYETAEYFTDITDDTIEKLISINVFAMTLMTRLLLKDMIQAKRGAIVNISSVAGACVVGCPFYTVYAGTKAYIGQFSKSLNLELRGTGVKVQEQIPYYVATMMSRIKYPTFFTPSPKTWAQSAVRFIGKETSIWPYWPQALMHWVQTNILPRKLNCNFMYDGSFAIYKKAHDPNRLKRKEAEKAAAAAASAAAASAASASAST